MYISKLNLQNYRNYQNENFEFSKGINIISGLNAQGKTNCAEAIFYLCTGFSPRVTREKQVIMRGAQSAKISAIAKSQSMGELTASIEFFNEGGKKITVNGVSGAKIGELIGNINAVMFNPQELKLVQESPEDRRRFLDIALSQTNRRYFYSLQKYRKILSQRNALLKEQDKDLILSTLPVWDEQLSLVACSIIYDRNAFIQKLKPLCKSAHLDITGGREELEIVSESKFLGDHEQIKNALCEELFARMEKDIELGYTSIGPHRDDLKIKINGEDARIYSSQGQQRTASLSLKLAELEIFKNHFGEYPVLILDDAMSELDGGRREKLLARVEGVQTIITCTDAEQLSNANAKVFIIEGGRILESR